MTDRELCDIIEHVRVECSRHTDATYSLGGIYALDTVKPLLRAALKPVAEPPQEEKVPFGIALDQRWRAPDGRLLRVVSIEPQRIGLRNTESNRLTYAGLHNFDKSQRWHLSLEVPAETLQPASALEDRETSKGA